MTNFDCTDVRAMLSAFVDDEIAPEARHQVERHLTGCKACRDLVSESEGLNQMIALDVQGRMWPVGLPAGFEAAVLGQTVKADRGMRSNRMRLVNWAGWVAAAACFLLATAIWMLDRQGIVTRSGSDEIVKGPIGNLPSASPAVLEANLAHLRSSTYSGSLAAQDIPSNAVAASHADSSSSKKDTATTARPESAALDRLSKSPALSDEDADTLASAAMMIDMLAQADLDSFADVDRIRQIAEYDETLPRLASLRTRLADADRPMVMAAESVLLRLVRGPISLQDLRDMHDTVARMNMAGEMDAITGRATSAPSI